MITRRGLLVCSSAAVALSAVTRAFPPPPSKSLQFDVLRNGSKLGTHALTLEANGDELTVHVVVDIAYSLGPVTLYNYSHRATERWKGDQVISIDTETDDDGDSYKVTGRRDASGLVITANTIPSYVAPPDALPATHWNRKELDGPWINTQDGKLLRPKVTDKGVDSIPTAGGGSMNAHHYVMSGDANLEMWYDDKLEWVGLLFNIKDSEIRYERSA